MAAITSAGVGSGLDVASIVSQLVAAERAGPDQRISIATTRAKTTISAIGNFRSLIASLQTAAKGLLPGTGGAASTLAKLSATSGDDKAFTASAGAKAVAGTYTVEVLSLATAGKQSSGVYASAAAVLGNGDVTLSAGGRNFTVTLTDGANTLADLRDKINAATDNTGVGATIVNDEVGGGVRLVLSSRETGTANAVSLSSTLLTTTESQAATDAVVKVDGYTTTSASNSVTTAVDGLTLNLVKAEPGTTNTLTVATDAKSSEAAVATFVNAYNNLVKFINTQTRYDAATDTAGLLLGDASVRTATQAIRSVIGGANEEAGTYQTLAALGITTSGDGTLTSDPAKFSKALSTDLASVQRLFAGENGLATRLDAVAKQLLGDEGSIKARTDGLNARIKDLDKQKIAVDTRIAAFEARTRAQFTALDTLMAKLGTTSTYLSQQLSNLSF